MKNIIIVALMFIGTVTFAQSKNAKASMEVDGVCGMCKARIEKACLNTKGVKFATWDIDTHQLDLIYDARKTNSEIIKNQVLAVGHDVQDTKATDEAYATVHACCKYRDEDVQDDHKAEEKEDN
ncbi:heavy-metal-associated domain-containing protein [uncultured Algibacter sp.]|uniref:heavy-metal-associated domain-containing protein n=1 Tax=uncultured Algibacter sp. TaxID=298659 RepID=UPI0026390949|nr:heavy-metal-associated domain-containing protein [uncultured Algibacter sp.]